MMSDDEEADLAGALAKAKEIASSFRARLPSEVRSLNFSPEFKHSHHVRSLLYALAHRADDIGESAILLFAGGHVVSGFILARSLIETAALAHYLAKKTRAFLDDGKQDEYDDLVLRGLVGSKTNEGVQKDDAFEAINVLTAIDHLEKTQAGTRYIYDRLSEYTHPNWAGAIGAYADVRGDEPATYLGKAHGSTHGAPVGLGVVASALITIEKSSDAIEEMLPTVAERVRAKG